MIVLPTSKEIEALPDIKVLLQYSQILIDNPQHPFNTEFQVYPYIEKLIINDLFVSVCRSIIKAKIYNDKEIIRTSDKLFVNLVKWSTKLIKTKINVLLELLNTIINSKAEYYKTNGKENRFQYPFGELLEPDEEFKKWVDDLKEGDKVDSIKFYSNKQCWCPAIILSNQWNLIKVRYMFDTQESFIHNKYFEIAPLGRNKSKYEWRETLKVGDKVDYYNFRRNWLLCEIIKIEQLEQQEEDEGEGEGEPITNIELKILDESEDEIMNDVKINLYSSQLAQAEQYSKLNQAQNDFDDDLFLNQVKKRKYAIMRNLQGYNSSSIYLVKYINTFGENGGFNYILEVLKNKISVPQQNFGNLIKLIQSSGVNLVEPFIQEHGEFILQEIKCYALKNAKENLRDLSKINLSTILETITSFGKRIYSSKEAKRQSQEIEIKLAILCIKSEFLDKQLFGAKLLNHLENKTRSFDAVIEKECLANILKEENLFEIIIKGHPSLIQKGNGVLKILFRHNLVSEEQLEILWAQICKTDLESRNSLLAVIKDILWDFTKEEIIFFLNRMFVHAEEIVNQELFDLLFSLKKVGWNRYNNFEVVEKVNNILWKILQSKKILKKELLQEVMKSFIKFMDKYENNEYIDMIIDKILNNENVLINLKILGKIFKFESEMPENILKKLKEKNLIPNLISSAILIIKSKLRQKEQVRREEDFSDSELFSENNIKELKRIFKFINKVVQKSEGTVILQFSEILRIWNVIFKAELNFSLVTDWLKNYIIKEKRSELLEDYIKFFNDNIDEFTQGNKSQFFTFIVLMFYRINIIKDNFIKKTIRLETQTIQNYSTKSKNFYILNQNIEQLEGFKKIWEIFLKTNKPKQEEIMITFLAKLYSDPEYDVDINNNIYKQEKSNIYKICKEMILSNDIDQCRKACGLLERLMRREEKKGFGKLRSFYSLKDLPKILLTIEKNNQYFKEKFTINMKNNKTIADLRNRISKEYKIKFDGIELRMNYPDGEHISHIENSQTLEQQNFSNKTQIIVKEYEIPEVEEVEIMDETGQQFSDKAILVFKEIFQTFSQDGNMYPANLAKFTTEATDGMICDVNDERIELVFSTYDNDKTGYLSENEFIQFFCDSAKKSKMKLNTVKQNLNSLGYSKDLQLKQKVNIEEEITNKQSLRYLLAKDQDILPYLLKCLKEDKGEQNNRIKELVQFLTPNFSLLLEIIQNPIKFLKQNNISNFLWNYYLILIEAITFKFKKICQILQFDDIQITQEVRKRFLLQIFSQEVLEIILRQIQLQFQDKKEFQVKIFSSLLFLEKIFKITLSFSQNNYIRETTNLIAYSILKKKEKQETKEQIATTQTEQTKIQQYPQTQKESEKSKKEISDVKMLLKIKTFLQEDKEYFDKFRLTLPNSQINKLIIDILHQTIEQLENINSNKKITVKAMLIILLSSLINNSDNIIKLMDENNSKFKNLLISGLTHEKTMVKLYFKNFYTFLTNSIQDFVLKSQFLQLIIQSIKASQNNDQMHVMIDLATNLLNEISEMKQNNENDVNHSQFDFSKLFVEFTDKLMNYQSKEKAFSREQDNTLIAILVFMEKLLKADEMILKETPEQNQRQLVQFIFKKCLFNVSNQSIDPENVLCQSRKSRHSALELLMILLDNNIKLVILIMLTGFQPLSNHLPLLNDSQNLNYLSSHKINEYVGIRNPGCVCYMNAMLQQFYSIPSFRYGILLANDYQDYEKFDLYQNHPIDDNVFHQLQKMFSFLDMSQRQDFDPRDFCGSYKDFTGQRVNVMVQQDAQEFLNMIFDKLEKSLKPTPFKGILDSVFGGKTCNVFTCQNCGFVRSNEELFYNLSLEVKNMENINDSFEKFIHNETISDYMCDNCKKKCDVSKQCFLKELPNVLIIHLQKIIFDLEALANIKISSKYEFGKVLNLKDYLLDEKILQKKTEDKDNEDKDKEDKEKEHKDNENRDKEHKDDEQNDDDNQNQQENIQKETQPDSDKKDFEYKLVGVVIHKGNAEFGHYISLINVNKNDPNRSQKDDDLWLEFDDHRISRFNMNNFEEECFGTEIEKDYNSNIMGVDINMSKSAYILVYNKVKTNKLKFHFTEKNIQEKEKLIENLRDKNDYVFEDNYLITSYNNLGKHIPDTYQKQIQEDNVKLILESQLFTKKFTNCFAYLIQRSGLPHLSIKKDSELIPDLYQKTLCDLILKIVPKYMFNIYCITNDNFKIKLLVDTIETALIIRQDRIFNFFETNIYSNLSYLCNLLINHNDLVVRIAVSNFLVVTITLLVRKYNIDFQAQSQESVNFQNMNEKEKAFIYCKSVFNCFLKYIPVEKTVSSDYKKLSNYFQTLKNLCKYNNFMLLYLLQNNTLTNLYDFYMFQQSNSTNSHEKTMTYVLELIDLLFQEL